MTLGDGVAVALARAFGACFPCSGLSRSLGAASLRALNILVDTPHLRGLEGVHHDGHDVLAAG